LILDSILGRQNNWRGIYNPSRLPLTTSEFVHEDLDIGWHFLEWLTSGDVGAEDAIDRGEGAIIRRGAAKRAVYGDEKGHLHDRTCARTSAASSPGIPPRVSGLVLATARVSTAKAP
jgi:hypothetical protein